MILLSLLLTLPSFANGELPLVLESCEFRFPKPTLKLEVQGRTFTDNPGAHVSWTVRNAGPAAKFHLHAVYGHVGRDYSDKKQIFGMGANSQTQTDLELPQGGRATVMEPGQVNSAMFANCQDRLFVEIGTSPPEKAKGSVWLAKFDCLRKISKTALRRRCKVIR